MRMMTSVSILACRRGAADPVTTWTIGGDAVSNVIGHAFVVHAPDVPMDPPRIACGVITGK